MNKPLEHAINTLVTAAMVAAAGYVTQVSPKATRAEANKQANYDCRDRYIAHMEEHHLETP